VARGEGRVARFEHRMEILNLGRRESAVLCTLLLRGPQTPGELRGRSERMHRMEDLDEVQLVLQKLIEHDPPLAVLLPRQPGTKESRYADRMGGEEAGLQAGLHSTLHEAGSPAGEDGVGPCGRDERLASLEADVAELRAEVESLRQQLAEFRSQFEN
jgi:uncharacterized protein